VLVGLQVLGAFGRCFVNKNAIPSVAFGNGSECAMVVFTVGKSENGRKKGGDGIREICLSDKGVTQTHVPPANLIT
jgi:hypothetical protein